MKYIYKLTCDAFPEQYDVFYKENDTILPIAYIRLRFGVLTCTVPYVGGKLIFKKKFDDDYKGYFNDKERRLHLLIIDNYLYNYYTKNPQILLP